MHVLSDNELEELYAQQHEDSKIWFTFGFFMGICFITLVLIVFCSLI